VKGASAEAVRAAIAGGDYVYAQGLWNEYVTAVTAGGLSEPALAEAAELMEWSRHVLLCARAHAVERLRALHVAGAYGTRGSHTGPVVRESF
jgi:hypothetical protein